MYPPHASTTPTTQLTSKRNADMVVEHSDLAHRPRVLELQGRLLLDAEDDDILAAHADGGGSAADSLEGVLDLEEVSVGGEDGEGWCRCQLVLSSSEHRLHAGRLHGATYRGRKSGTC